MRITDTLDQLLRTLLTSSAPMPEAIAKAAAPSDGTPNPASDDSDSKAVPAPDDLRATGDTVVADEAMPGVHDSEAPVEIVAAGVQTPGDTDLERLEVTAKVAESLNLGFHLGSAVDRIAVAAMGGTEGAAALHEAAWLIKRYVELLERRPIGADIHASSVRLARTEELLSGLRELADQLERDESQPEPASMHVVPFEPAPEPEAIHIAPFEPLSEPEEPRPEPEQTFPFEATFEPAETEPEPEAVPAPFDSLPGPYGSQPEPEPEQSYPFQPAADEAQPEPPAMYIAPFEAMPEPEDSRPEPEPEPEQSYPFQPAADEAQPEPPAMYIAPFEAMPEPEDSRPEPERAFPFETNFERGETEPEPEAVPFDSLAGRYEPQPEPEPVQIVPFEPVLGRYGPELQPAPVHDINFEPAPEPPLPAEPRPEPLVVQTAGFSTTDGTGQRVDPALTPDDLPPLRHEIFVTAIRAVVALAVVTFLVLMLTLIAQWH